MASTVAAVATSPLTIRNQCTGGASVVSSPCQRHVAFKNSQLVHSHQYELKGAKLPLRTVSASRCGVVCKVKEGDAPPDFSLKDQNGRSVSLRKFKGRNTILYFYPADDTPGCTKQACSFRDSYTDFKKLGAEVVGVSSNDPDSHKAFAEKYNLPYTLLSDEGGEVRKEWGVPGDLFGILPGRQTYVIDKKGVVQLVFNNQFQPEKHVQETLDFLRA